MGQKLAIDFGTTNSVIAQWDDKRSSTRIVALEQLSDSSLKERPPIIPSLLYVKNLANQSVVLGQAVRDEGLDRQQNNRLFRNFKRGIVALPAPPPRMIDSREFSHRDAGTVFVQQLIAALPYQNNEIDQLVLTAPVAAFEGYLAWLNEVIETIGTDKIQVVDESTAAALGYAVTEPGAVVLVFDFGGGTLDLSLVQLPEHRNKVGGFLQKLVGSDAAKQAARVIAKAGQVIGGSDIDQWLLTYILEHAGVSVEELGTNYAPLLTSCEAAKILLSTQESTDIEFIAAEQMHKVTITRQDLENLLRQNGFYDALRRVVDKVMHVARQRGIFKEDIRYVLMVGGTSLMPSVQYTLAQYFTDMAVRADKPFTAVAEGALQLAAGYGLEDYLVHSYGLRHLDPQTGRHDWDEIIPAGSSYPLTKSIDVSLAPSHEDQQEIELVIGEIDTDAVSMIEVRYEDGQAIFIADASNSESRIVPLTTQNALQSLVTLDPTSPPGEARLHASFTVDDRRRLCVTVYDLKRQNVLLENVPLVTLQ